MPKEAKHPTREALVNTVLALLRENKTELITSEMVLSASGISKGSLYHHFLDFDDLLGTALVREFSRAVDESIERARTGFAACDSAETIGKMIRGLTRYSQTPAMKRARLSRLRLIVFSQSHPKFRDLLAAEQRRLTDAFAELFQQAQARGWINRQIDPRAAAVLSQAYSIGRIVDDIAEAALDDEAWFRIVDLVTDRVFGPHD